MESKSQVAVTPKPIFFNENLHVKVDLNDFGQKHLQQICVATANVGNSVAEQTFRPFDTRIPQHLADFGAMKPDLLAVQEFRSFPESLTSPEEFCEQVRKTLGWHRCALQFRNASPLSFGQAIFWNTKKFFPRQIVNKSLSETPDDVTDPWPLVDGKPPHFGNPLLGIEFYYVFNEKLVYDGESHTLPTFWVWSMHLPAFNENAKDSATAQIVQLANDIKSPCMFLGDGNTFRDTRGPKQIQTVLNAGFVDAMAQLVSLDQRPNTGEFLGYETDKFKQAPDQLSPLSHMYLTSHTWSVQQPATLWATEEQLKTRNTPSDHIACVARVSWKTMSARQDDMQLNRT